MRFLTVLGDLYKKICDVLVLVLNQSTHLNSAFELLCGVIKMATIYITSIFFFKKLAGYLALAIAWTLMPHMMAYVSKSLNLIHTEMSKLPLKCTQIIGATDFIDSYYYSVRFFNILMIADH